MIARSSCNSSPDPACKLSRTNIIYVFNLLSAHRLSQTNPKSPLMLPAFLVTFLGISSSLAGLISIPSSSVYEFFLQDYCGHYSDFWLSRRCGILKAESKARGTLCGK